MRIAPEIGIWCFIGGLKQTRSRCTHRHQIERLLCHHLQIIFVNSLHTPSLSKSRPLICLQIGASDQFKLIYHLTTGRNRIRFDSMPFIVNSTAHSSQSNNTHAVGFQNSLLLFSNQTLALCHEPTDNTITIYCPLKSRQNRITNAQANKRTAIA